MDAFQAVCVAVAVVVVILLVSSECGSREQALEERAEAIRDATQDPSKQVRDLPDGKTIITDCGPDLVFGTDDDVVVVLDPIP